MFDTSQCCRVPAFQSRLAHRQHTNTVPVLFAPGPDAHEKKRKTISPLSLLFLSCQPRPDVRHQPPSPSRVLWLLQCSTYTVTRPLLVSRSLLKDLSTTACSISNSIRLQFEESSPSCDGARVAALCISNHDLLLHSSEEGRILPRNNHSSCHTLPSTSTTFDSKFSNHGVASAAHKPTHIMTVRVAGFPPNSTWLIGPLLDQSQSLPSPLGLEESFSSSESSSVLLVLRWPWYCSTSPESSHASPLFELVVPD